MVLRDRIELSTSPLPMECSTTELPQLELRYRAGRSENPAAARYRCRGFCHRPAGGARFAASKFSLLERPASTICGVWPGESLARADCHGISGPDLGILAF